MKAGELRIGNTAFEYVEEDGIYIESNISCWDFERARLNNNEQCFEWRKPIPITEEWLLKFGFENGVDEMVFCNNSTCIYWHKHKGYFEINGEKYFKKELHKFQNLYYELFDEEIKLKDHE